MSEFKSLRALTVENFSAQYGKLMQGASSKCKSGFYLVAMGTEANPEQTTVFVSSKLDPKRTMIVSQNQYEDGTTNWCLQNARDLTEFSVESLIQALAE